jgi:predicted PurR-regulated permease PerM
VVKRSLKGDPLLTALAVCLLILSISALLYLGRQIFVPIALAILLSFVLAPAVRVLQSARFPHGIAVFSVVFATFALIGLLGFVVAGQLAGLAPELPKYQTTITEKISRMKGEGAVPSTLSRALGLFSEVAAQLSGTRPARDQNSESADQAPKSIPVVVENNVGVLSQAGKMFTGVLHPLGSTAIVLIFAIFVLAQREELRNRFIRLVGTEDLQQTTAVIDDATRRLSRLFLAQFAVNATYGLIIGIGLSLIGIPGAVLWGVVAGILRFVPYIGPFVGAIFPVLLAVAVDPNWSMFLWVLALFIVVEPLVGHALEPLLYGQSTGLSPVAVIVSATVWAFLWGPIGLVLATPLTVCLVVLGRHVAQLEFLDIMLGDKPALSPAELFYQRMLAGDPAEAILQARDFLKERALATYYDEVALEGIRLAQNDIARGLILPERQIVLRRSLEKLIDALANVGDPRPQGGTVGTEAAAAVVAVGPDRPAAKTVVEPETLPADWRSQWPIVCISARGSLDEVVGRMLAQVLTKYGLPTRALSLGELDSSDIPLAEVRMACLSFVEPLSTLHLRFSVRAVRRRFSGVSVMLGIWRQRDPAMGMALRQAARADTLATSINGALSAALTAAGLDELSMPTGVKHGPQGGTRHGAIRINSIRV